VRLILVRFCLAAAFYFVLKLVIYPILSPTFNRIGPEGKDIYEFVSLFATIWLANAMPLSVKNVADSE